MSRGRQRGLELGQAHGLETRTWQGGGVEDVAQGTLPNMPLKKLWYSEGEESETHSSIHPPSINEGSAGGRDQVELPNNCLWAWGAEVPRTKLKGNPF